MIDHQNSASLSGIVSVASNHISGAYMLIEFIYSGISLTEKQKFILRVLRWKLEHAGISGTAVDGLKTISEEMRAVSWAKCRALASKLAPEIRFDEYACCPDSHAAYTWVPEQPTTPEECAKVTCPHCKKPFFRGIRPLKKYPVFPIAPRLVRQWSTAGRAKLLRYRHERAKLGPNAPRFKYRDYMDGERYRNSPSARYEDEHTHALAISMDGFQIFKQYVKSHFIHTLLRDS